jgi:16S rRNA (cytidine1402-2'-O)-methyltransferase
LHEQFIRGAVSEIVAHFEAGEPRGEMTLVIAGYREDNLKAVVSISISEEVERLEGERGLSRSDAIKQAARSRGLSKREAYQLLLDEKELNKDESIG